MMLGEGGEGKIRTNVNFLLEEFGIALNNGMIEGGRDVLSLTCLLTIDSVTRMAYYKFHHPKEALVANGVLNRELARAVGKVNHTPSETMATTTQRYEVEQIEILVLF